MDTVERIWLCRHRANIFVIKNTETPKTAKTTYEARCVR